MEHQTSHIFQITHSHKCISVFGNFIRQHIFQIICKYISVFGKFYQTINIFQIICKYISVFFIRLLTLFVVSVFWSLGNLSDYSHFFVVNVFWSLGNFIRLLTFFVVSLFMSLENFIRLVTLFIISVFRCLGNFIRLVTLFIISLNCSQFMFECLHFHASHYKFMGNSTSMEGKAYN